jgi:hypothetical protein
MPQKFEFGHKESEPHFCQGTCSNAFSQKEANKKRHVPISAKVFGPRRYYGQEQTGTSLPIQNGTLALFFEFHSTSCFHVPQ